METYGGFFVGASGAATRTRVRFDNDASYALDEQAVTAFGGYATPSGWSFRAAVGALVAGTLDGAQIHELRPGIMGALAGSKQWTFGADQEWFIAGSAGLSVVATSTHEAGATTDPRYVAGDVRVGAIAGRTFAEIWKPYLLARAFGGPIAWTLAGADVIGTDTHHFQLGAGASVATAFGLTVLLDVSVLGEQGISLAVSYRL